MGLSVSPRTERGRGRTKHAWLRAGTGAVLAVAVLLGGFTVPAAHAAPRDRVLARAAVVKKQIDTLDKRTEILAEDYNAARERHTKLARQERAAERRLKATTKRTKAMQGRLSARAEGMYRSGPLGFLEVLLGATDFEAFSTTWDFLEDLNQQDASLVAKLKVAKAEQAEARRVLARREKQAAASSRRIAARKRAIESKLASRKRMLSGLEAEVAALDRAEERRRALLATRSVSRSSSGGRRFPPPTRAPRSEVVSIAKRYLGAPYLWGAEGPNRFDCSGFTLFVYRQVGVRLPRVSRDQINAGQRVSRGDLRPGDLVFFGSPIHHVGIYVGGGMMIHSPRSGDVVKISALHSDYAGACRP